MKKPDDPQSEKWLRALFSAKAVGRGGVVYRAVRDVERYAGRDAFTVEVRKRGFTLVQNGDQFVIFCNRDAVRLIVDRDRPRLSDRAFPTFRRSSVANANSSTRG